MKLNPLLAPTCMANLSPAPRANVMRTPRLLAAGLSGKEIVLSSRQVSARDALHLAIMERHGIPRILSFDPRFDGLPGVERLS